MKRWLILFLLLGVVTPCFSAATLVEGLWVGLRDNNDLPVATGHVHFYYVGGTTDKTVWTDANKTGVSTNPVPLDTYGRAKVYADGVYKLVVADSNNITVYTIDQIEFSSAINPASITANVGNFASMTVTIGTIASLTVSSASMSSAIISNSDLLNPNLYNFWGEGATITSATLSISTFSGTLTGSVSANLDANNATITRVATPSLPTDGANKGYVDAFSLSNLQVGWTIVSTTESYATIASTNYAIATSGTIVNTSTAEGLYLVFADLRAEGHHVGNGSYPAYLLGKMTYDTATTTDNIIDSGTFFGAGQEWASGGATLEFSGRSPVNMKGFLRVPGGSYVTVKAQFAMDVGNEFYVYFRSDGSWLRYLKLR